MHPTFLNALTLHDPCLPGEKRALTAVMRQVEEGIVSWAEVAESAGDLVRLLGHSDSVIQQAAAVLLAGTGDAAFLADLVRVFRGCDDAFDRRAFLGSLGLLIRRSGYALDDDPLGLRPLIEAGLDEPDGSMAVVAAAILLASPSLRSRALDRLNSCLESPNEEVRGSAEYYLERDRERRGEAGGG